MAGTQIVTASTIIENKIGFNKLSLSNRDNTSAPEILAGSAIEVNGSFFYFNANESVTGFSSITTGTTAFLNLTIGGTAGSYTLTAGWSSTVPIYVASRGGWYKTAASSIRTIYSTYKTAAAGYSFKQKITGYPSTTETTVISVTCPSASGTYAVSSAFNVYEFATFTGGFAVSATAQTVRTWIQARVNGSWTAIGYSTDTRRYQIAQVSTSVRNTFLTLGPGMYRISTDVGSGTVTPFLCYLYRVGRNADVTQ